MPNGQEITAVLFDMDETLIRNTVSFIDICKASFHVHRDRFAHVDESQFLKTVGEKGADMWQMMSDGVVGGDVARPYIWINTVRALKADESLAAALHSYFEEESLKATRLMEGAYEVLDALRDSGRAVGIVTNGFTHTQSRKIDRHAFEEHTDFVVISESAGVHKPDIGIFNLAMRHAKALPQHTIFVGDNIDKDIAGARGAGITSVLMDPEGLRRRRLEDDASLPRPHHVVSRLDEVLPLAGL